MTPSGPAFFAEAGVSYFNEDYEKAEDKHFTSARESVGFNFEVLPERIKLFHLHELYCNLEESDDYYFRSQQGLCFLLFRNFFSRFQFDYGYNSSPVPGNRKYDIAYIFSLDYEFEF